MRHEEFHILEELSAKNVKMGVVSLNTNKNGVCENETFAVAFYGEIFGILDFEQGTIKFPIQTPEQILELVQQNGEEIIKNFNGTFLIAVFDKRKNELIIYNDRFGTHPLYYCLLDNETFVFASEAKALFNGRTPDPDYVGLAELLSFDYCLESRTIFEGIEILLPATKIKVTSDRITMERYWCFSGKSLKKKVEKNMRKSFIQFLRRQ